MIYNIKWHPSKSHQDTTKQKNPDKFLYLRLTKNRRSKYVALDVYINPNDWNDKTGKVKTTAVNASQINNFITKKIAETQALSLSMETKSKFVTVYDIKSKLVGNGPAEFFSYFEKQIRLRTEEFSIGTILHYKTVLAKLKNYWKKERLYFEDVNVQLIKDFQEYLIYELKNHTNTIHSNLKIIRTVINDAVAEGLIPYEKNPFNMIKLRSEKTSRQFLSDEELDRLEDLTLLEGSQLNHHRNLYLFSAYTAGIRISDLLNMRWRNVYDGHLYFQIKKNKEDIGIKLPYKSLSILQNYRALAEQAQNRKFVDPDSFIFPLLQMEKDEKDKLKIYQAISSANAYANKDLRKLTKLAKIDKEISFHTARHSWAIRALQKGMRIEHVSKLMGHASVKNTEVYAKIQNEDLDKAMEVFNDSYRRKQLNV
ncbi:MAG TPA: site-specific integrase [Mucilaginibacter sp.]